MQNLPVENKNEDQSTIKTTEASLSMLFWPINRDMPAKIGHGLESIARYIEECVQHLFHGFVLTELREGTVKIEETCNLDNYKQYVIKASNDFIIGYTNICPVEVGTFISIEDELTLKIEATPYCINVDQDDVWQLASNPHSLDLWTTTTGRPIIYINDSLDDGLKVIRAFIEIANGIWIPDFNRIEFLRDENYLGFIVEMFKDQNAVLYRTVENVSEVNTEQE